MVKSPELRPWTEIKILQIELIRTLDIVVNATDFTRQYKMRLDKVADIVFGKESKMNRRKKLISNAN